MDETLLVATEIPHGYTWTLASRLGDMLTLAENMFGERNKDFTILGFEFCESGPRIWYPKSKSNIVIQLSFEAMTSEKLALYQLAHECIHLLSPSGKSNANVLEEGLAVYFSWFYVKKALNLDTANITSSRHYMVAGLLVEKIMELNPDFFRKAREGRRGLWEIKKEDIRTLCPSLNSDELDILVTPFEKFINLKDLPVISSEGARF